MSDKEKQQKKEKRVVKVPSNGRGKDTTGRTKEWVDY